MNQTFQTALGESHNVLFFGADFAFPNGCCMEKAVIAGVFSQDPQIPAVTATSTANFTPHSTPHVHEQAHTRTNLLQIYWQKFWHLSGERKTAREIFSKCGIPSSLNKYSMNLGHVFEGCFCCLTVRRFEWLASTNCVKVFIANIEIEKFYQHSTIHSTYEYLKMHISDFCNY